MSEKKDFTEMPQKPTLPTFLHSVLAEHGIDHEDVKEFTNIDLSPSRIRSDAYIVVTEKKIAVVAGSLGLDGPSKLKSRLSFLTKKKPVEKFTETEYAEFEREEFTSFAYE